MWDVQLQRRAVMNEMRQMAARPFASVEMQLSESVNDDTDQLITPVSFVVIFPQNSFYEFNYLAFHIFWPEGTTFLLTWLWKTGKKNYKS